jgi:Helix-turn-helix domain
LAKSPNPRRVKLHRNYSVEEAAGCLKVHKNTVRNWIKHGLPIVGGRGQTLILGPNLRAFLETRRSQAKRPCPPGYLFCLKCREPKPPAGGMVEYVSITATSGNLKALCPACLTVMHRRIKEVDLERFVGTLAVTPTHASPRLVGCDSPSLNCVSGTDAET